jgi:gliding motility-associated-like protein
MLYKIYLCTWFIFFSAISMAQPACTLPGQTPATALTICGNVTYSQSPLMNCYNRSFFVPGCTNENTSYGDNNPVYYKFTCKKSGTFGFTVMPWKPSDDYNWQLFDITGKNPNAIYTDKTLSIIGNWSGTLGPTGASSAGLNFTQCRSLPVFGDKNTFSSMPQLVAGHTYLLMIGSIEASGSYALTVGGGTADITDNTNQTINALVASCNNDEVVLTFSKKISCTSIAADGSDFSISPANATIEGITGISCNSNSETDSIRIRFSNPLPNGIYTLSIKNGIDNNTLSDACRNFIAPGTGLKLTISPFPSIDTTITTCKPPQLIIHFSKHVLCNSIAADGSDFMITGPSPVTITAAGFICSDAVTNTVSLQLNEPITTAGIYNIVIQKGIDGNTFLSTCNDITPSGTSYALQIKGTVSAGFTFSIKEGCLADTVSFNHAGGNGVNSWNWDFKNSDRNLQRPTVIYTSEGNQTATLIVSNGVCNDTAKQNFVLNPKLKVDFSIPDTGCADEPIPVINKTSNASAWLWDFSNGITSTLEKPEPVLYPSVGSDKKYTVTLTANNATCSITQTKNIYIKSNCILALPSAFTPNDDGLNDVFGPLNAFAVKNVVFRVFNRFGKTVFVYSVSNNAWNGKLNGVQQPPGIYSWSLSYTDPTTGISANRKGTVILIR